MHFCLTRHSTISRLIAVTVIALFLGGLVSCSREDVYEATWNGHFEKVKALLKEKPELISSKNADGDTLLFWAVISLNTNVVKLLIDNKADVNARNDNGMTPLIGTVEGGHYDKADLQNAELLLAHGADVGATNNDGKTPLHYAAEGGYDELAELLLAHEANVNAREEGSWTPLFRAASYDQKALAKLLLAHGADVNAMDTSGVTPLHLAAFTYDKGLVELLLENKAEVNAKDNKGETPLRWAEHNKNADNKDVVELLRQHGGHE